MTSPNANLTRYDWFYDEQIRRFEMQLVRAFSGWQYKLGPRNGQEGALKIVPCRMALRDKMAAAILRNLSDNTLLSLPMMTISKTGFLLTPERLQNPNHVESLHVTERARDPVTGYYTGEKGNSMTIERIMPRPFELKYNLDIWTSNEDQKHQLMEQILTVIYPAFDIQNSDNPLDWAALTSVYVEDVNFYSRSIPIGTDSDIEIGTIGLRLPFWLNPPAKIKHQTIIRQIITNINQLEYDEENSPVQGEQISQHVTTTNHILEVKNGEAKLLGPDGNEEDADGNVYKWSDFFDTQKIKFYPMVTQLRVRIAEDIEDDSRDIVGTLQPYMNDDDEVIYPNLMQWDMDIDTLPSNTIAPVHAIINPLKSFPGEGGIVAAQGRRYLITEDLADQSLAWGDFTASKHSIIQYKDGAWTLAEDFDISMTEEHFVVNLLTGRQLRWLGGQWVLAVNDRYPAGYWRIVG